MSLWKKTEASNLFIWFFDLGLLAFVIIDLEEISRRVATEAVQRPLAVISISLACIGMGILPLLIFNPEFSLLQIPFETFSAFSTIGLSRGITSQLSENSRYSFLFLMFFGRIRILNLMIGLLKSVGKTTYVYTEENILIN